jgi:peptidoglycan-associated lipoprotein
MVGRLGSVAGVAALALVAACSRNPAPATVTPDSAAVAQARADSIAAAMREQARQDSIAAAARADSIARAAAEQKRADSIRAAQAQAAADSARLAAHFGLTDDETATMADRIHFDYNRADLKTDDLARLQQKLEILQAHPQLMLEIAGNCDERGSEEYNMALGMRRSGAAKRWLVAHGIADDRITVTSYGEERPVDPGHDEAAWSQNRRDDFTVSQRSG